MCGLFATTLGFTACDDSSTTTDTKADSAADTSVTDTAADTAVAETTAETVAETVTETVEETTADSAQPDTTPADTTPAETTPTGACTNAADLAIIQSGTQDPSAKASECGAASCIAKIFESLDAFSTCVNDCMLNATLPGYEFALSAECTACYTASVRCTAEFCGLDNPAKPCVPPNFSGNPDTGPDSPACLQCRSDNNCGSSFVTCSGITPPTP